MRLALPELGVDVARHRRLVDRAVEVRQHQQAVGIVGVGRERKRGAGAHARQRDARGHQPGFDIGGVEAGLAARGRSLRRLRHGAVEPRLEILACHAESSGEPAGQRALGGQVRGRLPDQTERQRRQAVERQQRRRVVVTGGERRRQCRIERPVRLALPRKRGGKRRAAGIALCRKRQPRRAVVIVGNARHEIYSRILQQVGIGPNALGEPLDRRIAGVAMGCHVDQRREIDGDHRRIEIAGRLRREIPDAAGGADLGAGKPAHREPVYLQHATAQPQCGVHRIGGQAGDGHRAGLDLEIEVAVGEAVGALVGNEERGEGRQPLDIHLPAFQPHLDRGSGIGRLGRIDMAPELRLAEHEFEIGEGLARVGEVHLGIEARCRQAADRLVHVLGQPCREAGRLGYGKQQRAGKAECLVDIKKAAGFQPGAAGQHGGQRFYAPAARRRLRSEPDVADGGVASEHGG